MNKLSTGLGVLAFASTMAIAAPGFAASGFGVQFGPGQKLTVDCSLARYADDPRCDTHNGKWKGDQRDGRQDKFGNGDQGDMGNGPNDDGPGNMDDGHGKGGFSFSSNDRHRFHQNFGSGFRNFTSPGFSVYVGLSVPHSYTDLRLVPRRIYHAYPQFRGYLYFVSRRGDFVIVSPRSHRVVAVI